MAIAASLLNSPTISISSSPPRTPTNCPEPVPDAGDWLRGSTSRTARTQCCGAGVGDGGPRSSSGLRRIVSQRRALQRDFSPHVGRPCFQRHRMVPLLGGAFCACLWHFFYNSESLEVFVALQAALTVLGNVKMCLAAFRIYRSSEERTKNM